VTVFCLRTGHLPWRGDPRVWFGQTRFLSGWFTATAVIAQAHGLAINFLLVGRLSRGALAGFKLAQTTMLQPIQNVNQALISLLVPRMSRSAGAAAAEETASGPAGPGGRAAPADLAVDPLAAPADLASDPLARSGDLAPGDLVARGAAAARTLRREVRRLALVFTALATVLVLVGAPVGHYVLSRVPRFADVAALALPVLLQGGLYLIQAPFTAALRGMHRAKRHLIQYSVYSVASLVGLVAGADLGGLAGATWGLTVGAAVGLVASVVLYATAVRRLGDPHSERWVTELEPEPV
jgi:O-antigen/teichoic acid export membrane protein